MTASDLNGIRMKVAASDPRGVVSEDTLVTFEGAGEIVSARYTGGPIVVGYLVGRLDSTGTLRFCYAQTDRTGRVDAGISIGTIDRMPDGRLRLVEKFQWLTRADHGVNVFEEQAYAIDGTQVPDGSPGVARTATPGAQR